MLDETYLSLEMNTPEELLADNADYIRIELPFHDLNLKKMREKNFYLVDRNIKVEIKLQSVSKDFMHWVRMPIIMQTMEEVNIQEMAWRSFQQDRRFFITLSENKRLSKRILLEYMKEIQRCFTCDYKGKMIGFLAISREDHLEKNAFIHLAAVDEQYRRTGAALSLYAFAAQHYKKAGFRSLYGRISSANTAVMNLYSLLGAAFSAPKDVFVKG